MIDNCLFFVLEGEISVYYYKNDEEKNVYKAKKGEFLNEYSFITGQKSHFYVKSVTHATLLKLSNTDFIAILKENSKDYVTYLIFFLFFFFKAKVLHASR